MAQKPQVATAKNSITHAGKTIYLTNKELLAEVVRSKAKGQMSDELAKMLLLLANRYAMKGNFVNYSFREDMVAYAMMMLCRTWSSFNPEKSSNPFSYYTQSIKNSYIQILNLEKKQRSIRDEVLIDQGMNPSHGFSEGGGHDVAFEDEQNIDIAEVAVLFSPPIEDSPIERDSKGIEIEVGEE